MEGILYDGAGNLFLMCDARADEALSAGLRPGEAAAACAGAPVRVDGLILLLDPSTPDTDFSMHYYNRDGSGGMMCGNGGRCVVSFARDLGILPASPDGVYRFGAAGSIYTGEILEDSGARKRVKLRLPDVTVAERLSDPKGWFLDTGCPHFVSFLEDASALGQLDIVPAALPLRHHPAFPEGVNVDFVAPLSDGGFSIRTFERGVEAETLACGTGIVASAISAALEKGLAGAVRLDFKALGGVLSVDLTLPAERSSGTPAATGIFLTGPTRRH